MPPLFEAVLMDYQRNVAAAREPEVLATITTLINRLDVCNAQLAIALRLLISLFVSVAEFFGWRERFLGIVS